METKEFRIEIPEGYEIDKEKSTFEKIVFKKKEYIVNCWEDLELVKGYYINLDSNIYHYKNISLSKGDKNVFINEKYAKSSLALAQISQLLPYYDTKVDWNDATTFKYCIYRQKENIVINTLNTTFEILAFNTREEAERFLKHNEQLVKDYYMI